MGLDPGTIASITFLRKNSIVGLDHSCHYRKDIIGTPQITFRSRIRLLSGKHRLSVTIEFIKVFGLSTDKRRLLHFPTGPIIKPSVFIYGINDMLLGVDPATE